MPCASANSLFAAERFILTRAASTKNLRPTFQDAQNLSNTTQARFRQKDAGGLSPSIPLSALGSLLTVMAAAERGKKNGAILFPGWNRPRPATCSTRGYRSITPPGFSEERGLPARNVFIEPLSCFLKQLHRELWLSYL